MRHTGGPLRASGVGDCVRRNAADCSIRFWENLRSAQRCAAIFGVGELADRTAVAVARKVRFEETKTGKSPAVGNLPGSFLSSGPYSAAGASVSASGAASSAAGASSAFSAAAASSASLAAASAAAFFSAMAFARSSFTLASAARRAFSADLASVASLLLLASILPFLASSHLLKRASASASVKAPLATPPSRCFL